MPEKWVCVIDLKQRTWIYVGKDPRVAMILSHEGTRTILAEELADVTAKAREIQRMWSRESSRIPTRDASSAVLDWSEPGRERARSAEQPHG